MRPLSKRYLEACAPSVTLKYWRSKKKLVAWWLERLHGKDLRSLDLARDVLPHVPSGAAS